ncbi:PLDc N-terminal domain-containing protein [Halopiger xanaduensis]|uniref:Membrane protein n=1 Tax=Halopiger xanaduensis (strain DSM 18323 / JCM 14033 / SH-6) TaxID=797210 RepID=F8DBE0_HALXS|nr:PLDc N-terminal domain-containing protein [Halopiger xanaduensis]AEH35925.1 membrane protein [Halopiger xanaduensis SH-6]
MPSIIIAAGFGAFAFLIFAVLMAVYLGMVVWTYSDAQRNSTHPAFLWAVVVFFAPLLGLVLYVLLGRDATVPGRGY